MIVNELGNNNGMLKIRGLTKENSLNGDFNELIKDLSCQPQYVAENRSSNLPTPRKGKGKKQTDDNNKQSVIPQGKIKNKTTMLAELHEKSNKQSSIKMKDYHHLENDKVLSCYGGVIFNFMKSEEKRYINPNILSRHLISPEIRTKMVDWIIEVYSVFAFSDQTFFLAVHILDTYISKSQETLSDKDIHLIGMTSMLIASKFEESHPLRLDFVYEKIGYKTFSKEQIVHKELEILKTIKVDSIVTTSMGEFITSLFFDFVQNNRQFVEQYSLIKFIRIMEFNSIYYAKLITHFHQFNGYFCSLKAIASIVVSFDQIRNGQIKLQYEEEYYMKEWLRYIIKENSFDTQIERIYKEISIAIEIYMKLDYIGNNLTISYEKSKADLLNDLQSSCN